MGKTIFHRSVFPLTQFIVRVVDGYYDIIIKYTYHLF